LSPTKLPDSKTILMLFVIGAGLIVGTFTYFFVRRWPTFDPLVTATMIGVGLLLIVIYERLGLIHRELRTVVLLLERRDGLLADGRLVPNASDAKETAHAR
jgi:hypothetical protein